MQEEETFSSPAGNTRSRRSIKSSAREFSRNKADITQGKKPVGRRLELVDEDFEEEMASPEEDDQTEKGGGDDLESEKCATRNEYYKLLKRNEFLGTRYPHPETMERLRLYDDVDYITTRIWCICSARKTLFNYTITLLEALYHRPS